MDTSWQGSNRWYRKIVGEKGHYYHKNVIMPKLLEILKISKEDSVIDFGCGEGVLERNIDREVEYLGVDISPSMIDSARNRAISKKHRFIVGDCVKRIDVGYRKFSIGTMVLAWQNVENPDRVIENGVNLIKKGGHLAIVLNHPCFRIPRVSAWGVDINRKLQYRRIDNYMSKQRIPIRTNPGSGNGSKLTWSFHLPLSDISKILFEKGFVIEKIEEWISDKKSIGPIALMEDRARREFPLFMAILAKKI